MANIYSHQLSFFGPMQLQQNQFSGRGCNSLDENEIKVKNNLSIGGQFDPSVVF